MNLFIIAIIILISVAIAYKYVFTSSNSNKPINCSTINSIPQLCCVGVDNFLNECPELAKKNAWDTSAIYLKSLCNNSTITQLGMKSICPDKVTLTNLPKETDDESFCKNLTYLSPPLERTICDYSYGILMDKCNYYMNSTGMADYRNYNYYCPSTQPPDSS